MQDSAQFVNPHDSNNVQRVDETQRDQSKGLRFCNTDSKFIGLSCAAAAARLNMVSNVCHVWERYHRHLDLDLHISYMSHLACYIYIIISPAKSFASSYMGKIHSTSWLRQTNVNPKSLLLYKEFKCCFPETSSLQWVLPWTFAIRPAYIVRHFEISSFITSQYQRTHACSLACRK